MLTFIEILIGIVVIVGVARYIIKGYSATGVLFVGGLILLIVSALLFFMDTFTSLSQSDWWVASRLVPEFKPVIQWFFGFMMNSSSFLQQVQ